MRCVAAQNAIDARRQIDDCRRRLFRVAVYDVDIAGRAGARREQHQIVFEIAPDRPL